MWLVIYTAGVVAVTVGAIGLLNIFTPDIMWYQVLTFVGCVIAGIGVTLTGIGMKKERS